MLSGGVYQWQQQVLLAFQSALPYVFITADILFFYGNKFNEMSTFCHDT